MKVYIDKQTIKNVFFIRDIDLALLKSKSIPFKDLRNLLYYNNVARDDLLSWVSYQRAMEMKLFGRKFTEYSLVGPLKFRDSQPKHPMETLGPQLESVYKETKYYEDNRFYSYALCNDAIVIMGKNDAMVEHGFKAGQSSIAKTLFRSVLLDVGFYKFYFNDPVPSIGQDGVGIPELIAKIVM